MVAGSGFGWGMVMEVWGRRVWFWVGRGDGGVGQAEEAESLRGLFFESSSTQGSYKQRLGENHLCVVVYTALSLAKLARDGRIAESMGIWPNSFPNCRA